MSSQSPRFLAIQLGVGFIATLLAPVLASAQAPGLIAAYSFDEGTGITLADSSGNGWNGTLANGPGWVAGTFGNALSLDGVNDYVSIGDVDIPGNAFTLSIWVKHDAPQSGWGSIAMKLYTYGIEAEGNTLYFGIGDGSSWSGTRSLPLDTGVWQHVAAVFNGSNMSLWKNGVQVGSTVPATLANTNTPFRFGAWTSSSEFFKGQIDNARLYDRALTSAEIQTDMITPVGGIPASSCDLTQNGSVDADDVYLSVDMALGSTPCTADIIGPGVCNVIVTQRIVNAVVGQPCVTGTGQPSSVLLTWLASPSPNVAGHNVYRGTNSGGPLTKLNSSLVAPTEFTDPTVEAGQTYYYAVTAVDTSGLESAYSNQAVAAVPSS